MDRTKPNDDGSTLDETPGRQRGRPARTAQRAEGYERKYRYPSTARTVCQIALEWREKRNRRVSRTKREARIPEPPDMSSSDSRQANINVFKTKEQKQYCSISRSDSGGSSKKSC